MRSSGCRNNCVIRRYPILPALSLLACSLPSRFPGGPVPLSRCTPYLRRDLSWLIIAYGKGVRKAAVIGGGLLGLEAAKATFDLGLETHVVEFLPRLMPRQVDDAGSKVLVDKIKALGVQVHLNKNTKEILGNGKV